MNLFTLLRRKSSNLPGRARVVWARSSMSRTVSRTGMFLKTQIWVFPILALVVLAGIGYGVRAAIERTMKESVRSQLATLLGVETAMLETWFQIQASNAETQANSLSTREHIYKLLSSAEESRDPAVPLRASPIHLELRKDLAPAMSAQDYYGYFVVDRAKRILSSNTDDLIGQVGPAEYNAVVNPALEGRTTVCAPFPSVVALRDEQGKLRTGVPTMFVCAPVRDASFQVVGALGLRIRPDRAFTRILQLGRLGASGETYAFDKSGRMVSNSRFDEDLILTGLLPDQEDSRSLLNLHVRDPGGDVTHGFRPKVRRAELPLTKMAADAVAGNSGVDVEGYRDYRGVPVLGAWTWLPNHQVGVVTEIDAAEAFRPLLILQWMFWGLYALLGLCSAAIFGFTIIVAGMRREAQKAAIASQKLGQYTLEKKLGSGGMGVVYKGQHAILRRPTAIKLLHVEKVNDGSLERFEREVQITCQLNHPNTVSIYDFGRTPEGVFYYAMEFLDGIDLQTLVERYGPQSEGRVIHILRQVCGSLYEAHSLGLVHRDIKPANIMFNRRGAEPDFIKVLDFGLVKALDDQKQAGLTAADSLMGTPLYLSPEAIQTPQTVDARSDLYAVGAVGYFLLTGQPVFDAENLLELCRMHVSQEPMPPSRRLGSPIRSDLETVLLSALDKSRARRPQTARDMAVQLSRCAAAGQWSIEEADAWWSRHDRGTAGPVTGTAMLGAGASLASPPSSIHDATFIAS